MIKNPAPHSTALYRFSCAKKKMAIKPNSFRRRSSGERTRMQIKNDFTPAKPSGQWSKRILMTLSSHDLRICERTYLWLFSAFSQFTILAHLCRSGTENVLSTLHREIFCEEIKSDSFHFTTFPFNYFSLWFFVVFDGVRNAGCSVPRKRRQLSYVKIEIYEFSRECEIAYVISMCCILFGARIMNAITIYAKI